MFRGIWAAFAGLFPKCWFAPHDWHVYPLVQYDLNRKAYWIGRRCRACGRAERRNYVAGPRRGDAREILPDPFTDWYKAPGGK